MNLEEFLDSLLYSLKVDPDMGELTDKDLKQMILIQAAEWVGKNEVH